MLVTHITNFKEKVIDTLLIPEVYVVSITSERTKELVEQFGKRETDSGSAPVQIAILTERIRNLTIHLQAQSKDFGSRRGLLKLIGRRRRLQSYYQRTNPAAYAKLIKDLDLRR